MQWRVGAYRTAGFGSQSAEQKLEDGSVYRNTLVGCAGIELHVSLSRSASLYLNLSFAKQEYLMKLLT